MTEESVISNLDGNHECQMCGEFVPTAGYNFNEQACTHCLNDAEGEDCYLCKGTGIGQHGPPDTSICTSCGGKGYIMHQEEQEPDDFDDYYADDDYMADMAAEAWENSRINDNY